MPYWDAERGPRSDARAHRRAYQVPVINPAVTKAFMPPTVPGFVLREESGTSAETFIRIELVAQLLAANVDSIAIR